MREEVSHCGQIIRRLIDGFRGSISAVEFVGLMDETPTRSSTIIDRPKQSFDLAVENGDARLKALRINWVPRFFVSEKSLSISEAYLRQLIQLLESDLKVELWIVGRFIDSHPNFGGPELRAFIANLPRQIRKRVRLIHSESPVVSWAQDASKPLANGLSTLITPKMELGRILDHYVDPIQSLKQIGLTPMPKSNFRFEGGNLIVGSRNIFVGPQIVNWAMNDFRISRAEALSALSNEFGKPVIEIGYRENDKPLKPLDFHIDLTMAVVRDRKTGNEKILLGSVRKAIDLLKEYYGVEDDHHDDIILGKFILQANRPENTLVDFLRKIKIEDLQKRESRLNQIEKQLLEYGYEVVRIPDLINGMAFGTGTTIPEMYSYTNSIFSRDIAMVGEMGVRAWDDHVSYLMTSMGYKVLFFPVVQKSICEGGGVRCLSETYRFPAKTRKEPLH